MPGSRFANLQDLQSSFQVTMTSVESLVWKEIIEIMTRLQNSFSLRSQFCLVFSSHAGVLIHLPLASNQIVCQLQFVTILDGVAQGLLVTAFTGVPQMCGVADDISPIFNSRWRLVRRNPYLSFLLSHSPLGSVHMCSIKYLKPRYCPCSSTRFAVTTWSSETWFRKHAKCFGLWEEVVPQIIGLWNS